MNPAIRTIRDVKGFEKIRYDEATGFASLIDVVRAITHTNVTYASNLLKTISRRFHMELQYFKFTRHGRGQKLTPAGGFIICMWVANHTIEISQRIPWGERRAWLVRLEDYTNGRMDAESICVSALIELSTFRKNI